MAAAIPTSSPRTATESAGTDLRLQAGIEGRECSASSHVCGELSAAAAVSRNGCRGTAGMKSHVGLQIRWHDLSTSRPAATASTCMPQIGWTPSHALTRQAADVRTSKAAL